MDEERIINTLKLCDEICNSVIDEYRRLFGLAEEFIKLMRNEERQLPYHINVIDELHINENGHSRILLKLLQFKNEKGEYEFLDSLLRYIKERNRFSQFSNIQILQPQITQEKARIDLWIRDENTGYSIIFENKVYNAKDQEAQISRYIEKTKEEKFGVQNIFVVYLSSMGKEPEDQSWGKYKEEFKDRYINLSFRDDIITWLKKNVLPNIRYKDVYLYTAIMQYKDYLEGHFRLRTINKQMNMKLENLITSHFELDKFDDTIAKIEVLNEKKDSLEKVINAIDSLKKDLRLRVFDEWKQKVQNMFPNDITHKECVVGVRFSLDGKPFVVKLNNSEGNYGLHCQVNFEVYSDMENTRLMDLQYILPYQEQNEKGETTLLYKDCGYEGYNQVLDIFCKVIERCKEFASLASER